MSAEWEVLCRGADFLVEAPLVHVQLGDQRRHRVTVEEHGSEYLLSAIVVRRSVVGSDPGLALEAWLRNRTTRLVGFRIDTRGRLIGEAWVPKAGLTAEEFQLVARTVAAECDRFEYALTGRDVE